MGRLALAWAVTPTVSANESSHAPVADVQYCLALFASLREPFATHAVHLPPPGRKVVQERMLQGATAQSQLHVYTRSLLCPNARILHTPQFIVRRKTRAARWDRQSEAK